MDLSHAADLWHRLCSALLESANLTFSISTNKLWLFTAGLHTSLASLVQLVQRWRLHCKTRPDCWSAARSWVQLFGVSSFILTVSLLTPAVSYWVLTVLMSWEHFEALFFFQFCLFAGPFLPLPALLDVLLSLMPSLFGLKVFLFLPILGFSVLQV